MEVINITEAQRNELCNELARLVFEIRKDKSVKCIYFAPYKGLGTISGNVLEITIVRSNKVDGLEKIDEYNKLHQKYDYLKRFGFKIIIDIDDICKYTLMDLNPSECRRSTDLMNSVILYDESGEFTRIKEKTARFFKDNEKKGVSDTYYYYTNRAEIFPPLDKTLDKALDIAQMERDTIAVKEFTR